MKQVHCIKSTTNWQMRRKLYLTYSMRPLNVGSAVNLLPESTKRLLVYEYISSTRFASVFCILLFRKDYHLYLGNIARWIPLVKSVSYEMWWKPNTFSKECHRFVKDLFFGTVDGVCSNCVSTELGVFVGVCICDLSNEKFVILLPAAFFSCTLLKIIRNN